MVRKELSGTGSQLSSSINSPDFLQTKLQDQDSRTGEVSEGREALRTAGQETGATVSDGM